ASGSTANATARIGGVSSSSDRAVVKTEIGGNAILNADFAQVLANAEHVHAEANSSARDVAGASDTDATATVVGPTTANVLLDAGSQVTGIEQVQIRASVGQGPNGDDDTIAFAYADLDGGGDTDASAFNTHSATSQVDGADGTKITTHDLSVKANTFVTGFSTTAFRDGGFIDFGSITTVAKLTPTRLINWNADVVLLSGP